MTHDITVVMPTSPIPSHPSTDIIDRTLASVRVRLPDVPIIITADGVRPEQEHRRADYEEYLDRLRHRVDGDTLIDEFPEFAHQSGMLRGVLPEIRTETLLYIEHDIPLIGGDVDWTGIRKSITSGRIDLVRLHHETRILVEHQYLMLDKQPRVFDVPILRTVQWSQRPHVVATKWYRNILDAYFPDDARTMIEDRMYGVVEEAVTEVGMSRAWQRFRLGIYAPDDSMLRCLHIDGREGDEKYPMEFGGHE